MSSDLHKGTLTFLFTDIEGSTHLWEQHPEGMKAALARHDELVSRAVGANSGQVIKSTGDGTFAVFASAVDAVSAVVAAERALQVESWPETGPVRVRMALHTGEAEMRDGDYFGTALNRAARLMAVASGGQSLLSQITANLVQDRLPHGVSLRDLGEHRLKDLERPEHVYQVLAHGLTADFPPLKSLNAFPHNLPVQLTSFVGRERELDELKRLLASTRLLTLTGSGGTGKTRLALQLASDVSEAYLDGVWFVELASVTDPAFVLRAIAAVLGVREQPSQPLLTSLLESLRAYNRPVLLILDNCEHVIDVCAQFVDAVLRCGANTRLLATSREGLGVPGEQSWRVASLQTPDPGDMPALDELAQVEAVRLFVERARLVLPSFALTAANAPAVCQIVMRLDGIPLAIELVAARVRALSPERIAERLSDRFRLLTGGSRTALPRQQTLRGMIDWSYSLLAEPERLLLRRLAVFVGGWTLEACEAVCADRRSEAGGQGSEGGDPTSNLRLAVPDILPLLVNLVNKSLVVVHENENGEIVRYRLLETIRQYARELLADTGEGATVRDRHLAYFARWGQDIQPQLGGDVRSEQVNVVKRVTPDLDNVRGALEWTLETGRADDGLPILDAYYWVWILLAAQSELVEWYRRLLAQRSTSQSTSAHSWACLRLAGLYVRQNEWEEANAAVEQALAIQATLDDPYLESDAYFQLTSIHMYRGDLPRARTYAEKYRDVLAASNKFNEWERTLYVAQTFALLAFFEGDYRQAQTLLLQSYRWMAERHGKIGTSANARILGYVLLYQNDVAQAGAWLRESLVDNAALGDKQAVAACLSAFAGHALARGELRQAAQLLGASEAACEAIRTPLLPFDVFQVRRNTAALREQLDEAALKQAWAEGRALTVDQAMQLALAG